MKRLVILLIALAVLYSIAETAAGSYVEGQIESVAAGRLTPGAKIDADVSTPLLPGLLTQRKISRVKVSSEDLALGVFTVDQVTAIAEDVKISPDASIREQKPVVSSVGSLVGRVDISEEQVSKMLPPGLKFELTPGEVTLKGQGLTLKGRLKVSNKRIAFEPASGRLPLTLRVPSLNLGDLPLVSCFQDLQIFAGHMQLSCRINNPATPDFLR